LVTGFLVGKPATEPNSYYSYFVTAKHVLEENGKLRKTFYLRLNMRKNTSDYILIQADKTEIYTHKDSDIDIAVIPFAPNQDIYDYLFIPDSLIATSEILEKFKISEGDDMFFSGLFTSHHGQKRNQPIVRFGKVALMSEEKIEWKEKNKPPKLLDLYLVECQSFGGNSGSPVFFSVSAGRDLPDNLQLLSVGEPSIFLAGIMKGSYISASELDMTDVIRHPYSYENVGIAAVVPSYFLKDILAELDETK
jgi:hypothetical protein